MITILRFILFFLLAPVVLIVLQAAGAAQDDFHIVEACFQIDSSILDSIDDGICNYDSGGALLQQRSSLDGKIDEDEFRGYQAFDEADAAQSLFSFLADCVATNKLDNIRGYRYVSEGEIKAIQETGMLRGGNPGETFFTKDLFKTSTKAQQRLSLQGAPTHRIEFDVINNPTMQRNGTKVDSLFGQPGKGAEFMTIDPVRVNLINVQPLQ